MGGRVYDPNLGRFIGVDPIIGGTGSQALNPYSYIGNNPLSGKDPTGYQACSTGTNITGDGGPSCGDLGVSSLQVGTPSKSETDAAKQQSSGSVRSNTSGAGGNAADQQTAGTPKGNTPQTQPGQPAPNVSNPIVTPMPGDGSDAPVLGGVSVTARYIRPMVSPWIINVLKGAGSLARPIAIRLPWLMIFVPRPAGDPHECECGCGQTCGLPASPLLPNTTPGYGDGIRGPTTMTNDNTKDDGTSDDSTSDKSFWKSLDRYRGKIKTNGETGKDRRFYEWDYTHGDVEVYDRNGRHLGTADADTGKMIKPPVAGRTSKNL